MIELDDVLGGGGDAPERDAVLDQIVGRAVGPAPRCRISRIILVYHQVYSYITKYTRISPSILVCHVHQSNKPECQGPSEASQISPFIVWSRE